MVGEPGSRSKETLLLMVAEDEAAFGEALAEELDGQALWMAAQAYGGLQPTYHRLLRDALDAADQHAQAFLRVVDRDGVPTGPILQYLASQRFGQWLPDGREALREGRLAYKWFPAEHPAEITSRFHELVRIAWRHLFACTHPHLADWTGRPIRRARIGRHAKAWVQADPTRLLGDPRMPWGLYQLLPRRTPRAAKHGG
jgi:hypothetical protein